MLPKISRELPGMNMGYYRVKVSKEVRGKEFFPKNFNEETEVGVEFCTDRPTDENLLIRDSTSGKTTQRGRKG